MFIDMVLFFMLTYFTMKKKHEKFKSQQYIFKKYKTNANGPVSLKIIDGIKHANVIL